MWVCVFLSFLAVALGQESPTTTPKPVCGGWIQGKNLFNGSFTTPSWPSPYPPNVTCAWEVISPLNSYIKISIRDIDIYHLSGSGRCEDYLRVQMKKQSSISTCGYTKMLRFYSLDNYVKVVLHAGPNNVKNTGFQASFNVLSSSCPNSNYTGMSGILYSPNYPDYYPVNVRCLYVITVPQGYRVSITFPFVSLVSKSCTRDHVMVYDGGNISSPPIARICTPTSLPDVSSGHVMTVRFYSDDAFTSKGFIALYSAVKVTPSPIGSISTTLMAATSTEALLSSPPSSVPSVMVSSAVTISTISSSASLMVTPSLTSNVLTPTPTHPPLPLELDGVFQVLRDVTLKGHAITTTITSSALMCVLKCQRTFKCKSVTFETSHAGGYCTLHDKSLQSQNGKIQPLNGATYYQSVVA